MRVWDGVDEDRGGVTGGLAGPGLDGREEFIIPWAGEGGGDLQVGPHAVGGEEERGKCGWEEHGERCWDSDEGRVVAGGVVGGEGKEVV